MVYTLRKVFHYGGVKFGSSTLFLVCKYILKWKTDNVDPGDTY